MRLYRVLWTVGVALAAGVAGVGAAIGVGWWAPVAATAAPALLGWIFAAVYDPDSGRGNRFSTAVWFAVAGVLVVGLPAVVGAWTVVALAGLALAAPPTVAAVVRLVRLRRPVRTVDGFRVLSDRDLERRWQRSTSRLLHPGTTPPVLLSLVVERAELLDEMERRRPGMVADLLGLEPERRGENGGW